MESLAVWVTQHILTQDVGKHVCYLVAASWVFRSENTKMRTVFKEGIHKLSETLEDHGTRIERIETKVFPKEGTK